MGKKSHLFPAQEKDEGGWDQGRGSEGTEEKHCVLSIPEGRTNRTC